MRIAIVGSRDFPHLDAVEQFVRSLEYGTTVVTGGARGVDRVAETAARARGLAVAVYLADWTKHGKAAGMIRNRRLVESADEVVAFHSNASRGTANAIAVARKLGKPVRICTPEDCRATA